MSKLSDLLAGVFGWVLVSNSVYQSLAEKDEVIKDQKISISALSDRRSELLRELASKERAIRMHVDKTEELIERVIALQKQLNVKEDKLMILEGKYKALESMYSGLESKYVRKRGAGGRFVAD